MSMKFKSDIHDSGVEWPEKFKFGIRFDIRCLNNLLKSLICEIFVFFCQKTKIMYMTAIASPLGT
jgi:hypothetical protein